MGQSRPLFLFIFVFSTCYNLNWKSVDGVLGIQTWGGRMEGANESAELRQHPYFTNFMIIMTSIKQHGSLLIFIFSYFYNYNPINATFSGSTGDLRQIFEVVWGRRIGEWPQLLQKGMLQMRYHIIALSLHPLTTYNNCISSYICNSIKDNYQ